MPLLPSRRALWPTYGSQHKAGGPDWTTVASLARLALESGCTSCTGTSCSLSNAGNGTAPGTAPLPAAPPAEPAAREEGADACWAAGGSASQPLPSLRPQADTIAATDTELQAARAAAATWFSALGSVAPPAGRSAARFSRLLSSRPAAAARGPGTTAAAAHSRATPSPSLGFFAAGSVAPSPGPAGCKETADQQGALQQPRPPLRKGPG